MTSTQTEIIRTLTPFFNGYVLNVAVDLKTPKKQQEYLQNNIVSKTASCLESAHSRLRKESKGKNDTSHKESLGETLGLSGVSDEFLESVCQEIGRRFTWCVHLLVSGPDSIEYARNWHRRDKLIREIIREELDHRQEQQRSRRQATDLIHETERDARLLHDLQEKLSKDLREIVREEIEPLMADDEGSSYASSDDEGSYSSDGGSGSYSSEGSYEDDSGSEEDDQSGSDPEPDPEPPRAVSRRTATVTKRTEDKKTENNRSEAKKEADTEPKQASRNDTSHKESVKVPRSESSREVSKKVSGGEEPARKKAPALNIIGLNREEPVREPVPQEWVGKSTRGRSKK